MSTRNREKDLLAKLIERSGQETMQILNEYLALRLDRHKNTLVSQSCDLTRGRAQEVRDLLKHIDTGM